MLGRLSNDILALSAILVLSVAKLFGGAGKRCWFFSSKPGFSNPGLLVKSHRVLHSWCDPQKNVAGMNQNVHHTRI